MAHLKAPARAVALLAALLSGLACSLLSSGPLMLPLTPTAAAVVTDLPTPPDTRPADFTVTYNWREGSVAPPYHYEYTIVVAPDGTVTLTFIPGYPGGEDVPVWSETVALDAAQLDALYAALAGYGLFTTAWVTEDGPPVGGSSDDFSATANGVTVDVPAYVIDSQRPDAAAMASTLTALIAQDTWDKLEAQRQDYIAEHLEQ
ncbi:MAG: hypothetical protein IT317_22825 [Anaerolineales bacterium]|nr:hypothetical protein [Anaerolineales bacterium]